MNCSLCNTAINDITAFSVNHGPLVCEPCADMVTDYMGAMAAMGKPVNAQQAYLAVKKTLEA